jgi:uncharacterized protein YyaL (SSP411 family)
MRTRALALTLTLLLLLSQPAAAAPPAKGPRAASPAAPGADLVWREWGPAALRESRAKRRPILLFVTTPWCHLCRVMEATAFADPDVRRLIRETAIPVRLDGERRPDLNERYNLGGWPTTIFLVETGEPLLYPREEPPRAPEPESPPEQVSIAKVGSTFLTTGELKALLIATAKYLRENRKSLDTLYRKIEAVRKEEDQRPAPDLLAPDTAAAGKESGAIASALVRDFDSQHGGFGDPPAFPEKFPFPEGIAFATARLARGDARFRPVLEKTLRGLARGALDDQLAGGFHRYSASRDWNEPHYEKLLEVNANILAALAGARAALGKDAPGMEAAVRARQWIRAKLAIRGSPLFASAQDSGTTRSGNRFEEGAAYTWTRAEFEKAIAPMPEPDRAVVRAHFGLAPAPPPRGRPGRPPVPGDEATERRPLSVAADPRDVASRLEAPLPRVTAAIARGRKLLAAARAGRPQPEIFRTPYTDANARAASALLAEAAAFGRAGEERPPITLVRALWRERWVPGKGLRHEAGDGGVPAGGLLRDHVAMLAALIDAHEAAGDPEDLARAKAVAAIMEKRFLDPRRGNYFDIAPMPPGPGVPSPLRRGRPILAENAAAAEALLRLGALAGDPAPAARAGTILAWCVTQMEGYGRYAAPVGLALERLREPPLTIVVWAPPGSPARAAMLLAARGVYDPGRLIVPLDPAKDAPALSRRGVAPPPAPSLVVCRGRGRCAPPIRPGGDLASAIRAASASLRSAPRGR